MRRLVLLYGILAFSISAWSASKINGVDTQSNGKEFIAIYSVSEPIADKDLVINYRPRSIEVVFNGVLLQDSKSIVQVDHPLIDRVYTANKDGKVFSRIIFKEGLVASDYENQVGFEVNDDKIHLKISEEKIVPVAATTATDLEDILDKEVAKILSNDMPEKKDAAVAEVKEEKIKVVVDDNRELKESEIPVLVKKEEKKAEATSPYSRVFMSFVIIFLFGAAVAMMSRWWKRKTSKNIETNKIRVVTQHFLGPRKSLAIIKVAGETMLIGVTDNNINMIKSLSLLEDDSIENIDVSKSFGEALELKTSAKADADDDEEDYSFKQIKDRISSRVKEMRPL